MTKLQQRTLTCRASLEAGSLVALIDLAATESMFITCGRLMGSRVMYEVSTVGHKCD